MAELIDVVNAMFTNKDRWKSISNEDKEKNFFIINRYMCKKFTDKSKLFNDKLINKVSAMDTWYIFMMDKPYPKWFWSKSEVKKEKPIISEDEMNYLMQTFDISENDIEMLNRFYPDVVTEEIKYYKDVRKSNK